MTRLSRRTALKTLLGAAPAALVTRPAPRRALQTTHSQCPDCLRPFGLLSIREKDVQLFIDTNETHVSSDDVADPGRAWPVRCACGWTGTAVFFEFNDHLT